ncbi:hypothetical protein A5886_001664 [Enterococcus sp. 8G7_MSG3316]|uniref:DNA mismatch repair proteins mutS family domain-containing protein n=1 Tax=Candidatus Enterococcus testudinis TaxID=1834191 RepID=A0A242A6C0_9ENTE|nr:mannonate oxidoreductase [Enterococcus sp. 8G7_MSG3316]OTN76587.1 hypothetical protein A5886_001664 [Enterococcus sp. 8G7_MSG3316]
MNIPQAAEFEQIKTQVSKKIISDYGKKRFAEEKPAASYTTAVKRMEETKEAVALLNAGLTIPFMGMQSAQHETEKIEKGFILLPHELVAYSDFLRSMPRIKAFLEKHRMLAPRLAGYGEVLADFTPITDQIDQMIRHQRVDPDANRQLRKIIRQIDQREADLKKVFLKFLAQGKYLQDNRMIKKNDRYTLPVKAEWQHQFKGSIIERSNKGGTVFIEPDSVARLNDRLIIAEAEKTAIEYQILAELTGMIAEELPAIYQSLDCLAVLDVIYARGKFCREINGVPLTINQQETLVLDHVTHPLLGDEAVPLDLSLGIDTRCMVITGPNAGGKTVVLKTVALVCGMAHHGLFPAHNGQSSVPFLKSLSMDIGDQQSLANALSTFSGHMANIAEILAGNQRHSIVLLDEIGSGTEPNEGTALAIAIMDALYRSGALLIATTHYGEIKQFAVDHADFQTAAMAFDPETLTPKYRLLINQVGESNAFWIAEKMQIPPHIVTQAATYMSTKQYPVDKETFTLLSETATPIDQQQVLKKGDQVLATDRGKKGVFYQYGENGQAEVWIEDRMEMIAVKRIQLLIKQAELYPADYDLDQLFMDHHSYKFNKDLNRGSKKAYKQLKKNHNRP